MPKIPLGNFGFQTPTAPPRVNVPAAAFKAGGGDGKGIQEIGDIGIKLAGKMLDEQRETNEKVQLLTAHADIQNKLAELHDQTIRGIADGSVSATEADSGFGKAANKLVLESAQQMPQDKRPIVSAEALSIINRYSGTVRDAMTKRLQLDNKAGLNDYLEQQTRLALTDRDKALTQALSAIDAIGPTAGMSAVDIQQGKQKVREDVAYNLATRMVSGARDSVASIEASLKALDSPEYADLDPKRKEILYSSLMANRSRLESRAQIALDRREKAAERTIDKIDQQISSGIPATPDMWVKWEQETRGTSQSDAFVDRVKSEEEVQRLLREPPEKQATFIRDREAALAQNGGSVRDRANLDRMKRVFETTRQQLQDAPLLFAQTRTGEAVKPLDFSMLLDPNRAAEVSGLMSERVATVGALRKQYGDSVKARVLLPYEAEMLTKTLDRIAPDQQIEIFRAMRTSIADDVAYQGTLAQIAADSPVKALAGSLAARGADVVKSHIFSPDEILSARQTAQLALLGESLLNPSKAQKATDGKTNSWIMPKKADMLRRFNEKVGDTFAGTPQALDGQFEFVQATYAGMLASRGNSKNPELIDTALFDQAIERTTPVMRQGGTSFLKPFVGMSDDQFREKLRAALPAELKPQYDKLPLRNVRSNQYVILNGARPVTDKEGNPLIVTVQP